MSAQPKDWLDHGARCLEAALYYRSRGWSPLALCPPDHVGVGKEHAKQCQSHGKAPLHGWKDFQTEPAPPETISAWWRSWPNANVGLALGPVSGLVGIDVDGPDGEEELARASAGDLPLTLEFTSGKGRRLLYHLPAGAEVRTTHHDRQAKRPLSLLAKGSQTVMPPSRHVRGPIYQWLTGRGPGDLEPAAAPAWLLAALRPAPGERAEPLADGEEIPEGRRDNVLTSMAGTMRARGFSVAAIRAALEVENQRCVPPKPAADLDRIAASVGRYPPEPMAGATVKTVPPLQPAPQPSPEPELPTPYLHDQLLDASFPAQRWVVDGIAPAGGLVLLGGKKKLGKSWVCLQIALAVAAGQATLGKPTYQGSIFYLCLEDGDRRLQDRLRKQQAARGLPIEWYTTFPKLDGGGLGLLRRLLERRPRLLVIDTLAAAKSGKIDENASGPMADLGNALREAAQFSGACIITTHHHGKAGYGDPGDDLRGSSALGAAADLNIGLYRVEDGFRLRGEGRDIEPFDLALAFDAHGSWTWKLLGDARTIAHNEADEAVLSALHHLGEADAAGIASVVNRQTDETRRRLTRLAEEGKVQFRLEEERKGRGRPRTLYFLPAADTPF